MIARLKHVAAAIAGIAAVCGTGTAAQAASFIDFETTPIGVEDNLNLNEVEFKTSFGHVTFGVDNNLDGVADENRFAYLEQAGGTRDRSKDTFGFVTDYLPDGTKPADVDTDENSDLGNYFLRTQGLGNGSDSKANTLLITYHGGMTNAAQGELWDIDGTGANKTEQWRVEALGDDGNVLASIDSPLGTTNGKDSLDGKAWTWNFDREENDIRAIRILFTGSKTSKSLGVAFDNFHADFEDEVDVPEPTALLGLLAVGTFGFIGRKRR